MHIHTPVLMIGCGQMGKAILRGLLQEGIDKSALLIVEKSTAIRDKLTSQSLHSVSGPEQIADDFKPGTVLIAVKPQQLHDILPAYRKYSSKNTVFLSVAAGITITSYESLLTADSAIVRVMPNTPSAIGRGVSVLIANAATSDEQKQSCTELMALTGKTIWINDESHMDAITALSGGGPAYVFLMIEYLANAGIRAGLDAGLANELALHTVAGAGELARLSDDSVVQLRKNVTSPNGTTQAALDVLMKENSGLQTLLNEAIRAAKDRSIELGR